MPPQPIVLWGTLTTANPMKVAIILEELAIPYEWKVLDWSDFKKEPYVSLNPNGRVPSIQDPNSGVTIFESGACIDYLVETYDTKKLLTPSSLQAKWAARSWRDFQMSGQGPSFGQAMWFSRHHHESLPSAITRYQTEALRIVTVINNHLAKQQTQYLTGDEVSYADLMWVPWNTVLPLVLPEGTDLKATLPLFAAWWERLTEREAVKKVGEIRRKASASS